MKRIFMRHESLSDEDHDRIASRDVVIVYSSVARALLGASPFAQQG